MAAAVVATATGALRRVLLPTIRRRLTTGTGQPLISFTDVRAGTTKAHQAEVAARRQLREQKMRTDEVYGMVEGGVMWLVLTGLCCWAFLARERRPQDCRHQSGSTSNPASYHS